MEVHILSIAFNFDHICGGLCAILEIAIHISTLFLFLARLAQDTTLGHTPRIPFPGKKHP